MMQISRRYSLSYIIVSSTYLSYSARYMRWSRTLLPVLQHFYEQPWGRESRTTLSPRISEARADIHYLARRVVYLLNLELFVEHDKTVGRVVYDVVREALRLVLKIGQTHRYLRLALIDRDRLFAAGVVSAGAAVQLVRGLESCPCGEESRLISAVGRGLEFALDDGEVLAGARSGSGCSTSKSLLCRRTAPPPCNL